MASLRTLRSPFIIAGILAILVLAMACAKSEEKAAPAPAPAAPAPTATAVPVGGVQFSDLFATKEFPGGPRTPVDKLLKDKSVQALIKYSVNTQTL